MLPSDSATGDRFGLDVALVDGTLVIGAPKVGFQGTSVGAGSAYVFTKSGGSWAEKDILTAGVDKDHFGFSVSVSGDTVVVGAPQLNFDPPPAATGPGTAYVYKQSGNDWNLQATLSVSGGATGDKYGIDTAISGNTIVVGASEQESTGEGAAYVYTRSGNTWTQQDKLVASDADSDTKLGESVAIAGGDILVGATNLPMPSGPGTIYVFDR